MENIWQVIKTFLSQSWIEHGLLGLLFIGLGIVIVLTIILIIKTQKDIIKNKKERRKKDKQLLKFISNKRNKTY